MLQWRRQLREQDLERELRSDLELEAQEQQEKGFAAEEAQYAALRAFGNIRKILPPVMEWAKAIGQCAELQGRRSLLLASRS